MRLVLLVVSLTLYCWARRPCGGDIVQRDERARGTARCRASRNPRFRGPARPLHCRSSGGSVRVEPRLHALAVRRLLVGVVVPERPAGASW